MSFRVAIATLGCKTNHYDSAAICGALDPQVFEFVDFAVEADAYIVNSCAVTLVAERQSRQMAYRARRRNPRALVILSGCSATLEHALEREAPDGIDHRVGRGSSPDVAELLTNAAREAGYLPSAVLRGEARYIAHTRPYLKVEDGCAGECTYCVIPRVRGPVRSVPVEQAVAELSAFVQKGFREIVLTGIHVGQWGRDLPGRPELRVLLSALAQAAPKGLRIRLSSLEPLELDPELLRWLAQEPVFCPHLHIPLQSGSDTVLARMKRPYDSALFRSRIALASSLWPRLGLGTDVIVGFPSESEAEFEETYALLSELPFTYLHVFPYSPRPGTPAATFSGRVSQERVKARKLALMALGQKKREAHARSLLGQRGRVLLEGRPDAESGLWHGFSETYAPCLVSAPLAAANRIVSVRFLSHDPETGLLSAAAQASDEADHE